MSDDAKPGTAIEPMDHWKQEAFRLFGYNLGCGHNHEIVASALGEIDSILKCQEDIQSIAISRFFLRNGEAHHPESDDEKLLEQALGVMRGAAYAEAVPAEQKRRLLLVLNKIEKRLGKPLSGPRASTLDATDRSGHE